MQTLLELGFIALAVLMFAAILVFMSGEVSPRNQNFKTVLIFAAGIVVFFFAIVISLGFGVGGLLFLVFLIFVFEELYNRRKRP